MSQFPCVFRDYKREKENDEDTHYTGGRPGNYRCRRGTNLLAPARQEHAGEDPGDPALTGDAALVRDRFGKRGAPESRMLPGR